MLLDDAVASGDAVICHLVRKTVRLPVFLELASSAMLALPSLLVFPMVVAIKPNGSPGTMAATSVVPNGLSSTVVFPPLSGVASLPPKLRTVSVVGSSPGGGVTTAETCVGACAVKDQL
jgi:hypothetical protein